MLLDCDLTKIPTGDNNFPFIRRKDSAIKFQGVAEAEDWLSWNEKATDTKQRGAGRKFKK